MSERNMLLRKLQSAQFAAYELQLYLDTHPNDTQAIMSFRKYNEKADRLREEYESKYGPLFSSNDFGDTRWEWVSTPWPWETEREMR